MPKEADELLNFPSKLYVGTQKLAALNTEDPPLGFATPFGTDKAFEKRKSTVDTWCGNGFENRLKLDETGDYVRDEHGRVVYENIKIGDTAPQVMDNVVQSGFTFDKVVERYETSNKVFRVNDPRGFQLEIAANNMADILLNSEVKKGEIIGDFIWGRKGAYNFLTRVDHPSYQYFLSPTIARKKLIPGDHVYLGNQKAEMVYCGEFYVFTAEQETLGHDRDERYYWSWSQRTANDERAPLNSYYTIKTTHDPKPFKVFQFVKRTSNYVPPFTLMRSPGFRIISEGNPLPPEFVLNTLMNARGYIGGDMRAFFATNGELMAFKPTYEELLLFFLKEEQSGERYKTVFFPPGIMPPIRTVR